MGEPLVGAEDPTAFAATWSPMGIASMAPAACSFDILQLPADLVVTIGQQLPIDDRMMLAFTCKTLKAILHPPWMRSRLTADERQAVGERIELYQSDLYTYCPSCNKVHTNIKEHQSRHDPHNPGRIEHAGCAAGKYMPNYIWETDSPVITYQEARMLANRLRYGPNAGMSPAEFSHTSYKNSTFSWQNDMEVQIVGDKDLFLKSTLRIMGPKRVQMIPPQDSQPSQSPQPLQHRHHLCRHISLFDISTPTLTLETFKLNEILLGQDAEGCHWCFTDWVIEYKSIDDQTAVVTVTTYNLIGNVCDGTRKVWGDFFTNHSLKRGGSSAPYDQSDFPYPVGILPGLWDELEAEGNN